MQIITLTTDFGLKDYSVSAVKGAIYTEFTDVKIVDVSHLIAPFNTVETAYVLKNTYNNFPKGTIHIIGVDSEFSPNNKHLAIELDGHFFICADNGIISMITSEINPTQIVEINIHSTKKSSFPTLDIFPKIACHIARGGKLSVIGKRITEYRKLTETQPKIKNNNFLITEVIYVDNYGNIVTNLKKSVFESIAKGREFSINTGKYSFNKIYNQYNDIVDFSLDKSNIKKTEGSKLALFNSNGMLEISLYRGNSNNGASSLLGIDYGHSIYIEFFNEK